MGQNLEDIQVKSPYEYRVLTDVSPLIMFMICNADVYKNGEFLNEETDPVENSDDEDFEDEDLEEDEEEEFDEDDEK